MKNPPAIEKLLAEIDESYRRGKIGESHIGYGEASRMPYLVAHCEEGMRLHSSVALRMPRNVPAGRAMIAGRHFPEGQRVSIKPAVLHYDTTIFGPDADKFNPDRWINGDSNKMDR